MRANARKPIAIKYEEESPAGQAPKARQPPAHWRAVLEGIEIMRSYTTAPVDTMGCSSLSHASYPLAIQRYHVLVGLMLSSQTRDEITAAAMRRLQSQFSSEPMSPHHLLALSVEELSELIKPVSFYRRKAKYVLETSRILVQQYGDDIPGSVEKLMELPGVGPKMVAWKRNEGIGVDVHVHRIANRLGWAHAQLPEQTRRDLQDWLPAEYWPTINKLLVGFGQTICTAIRPKCHDCAVSAYCPYYLKSTQSKKRKKSTPEAE